MSTGSSTGPAPSLEGKAACVSVWQQFFTALPDYRNALDELLVSEDTVTARGRSYCATEKLNGPALWRARVKAGLIVEWRVTRGISTDLN